MQKLFKNKNFLTGVAILFGLAICLGLYTVISVVINVRRASPADYTKTPYYPPYPTINMAGKTPAEIALIERGQYLATAGDCIACHTNTDKRGPSFAGGLAMNTAFGTMYTPNITPDKDTGIGTWTDDQFINAMRHGVSPTGAFYYPGFPYLFFNRVTTDDLKAIKAYLNNIPAVRLPNRENDMIFPFNIRFLQLGWRILFFYFDAKGPYQNDPTQSAAWNRGNYLVEGLGHCAMCHTPSYNIISHQLPLGAPIHKYHLTGAYIQGYLAPNITKSNLGAVPDDELLQIFKNYHLIGGGEVHGPMVEAIHDSLIKLTDADLLAIITYLKTVQSTIPPQPKIGTSSLGESIYNNYCAGCHTFGVAGAPKLGDALSWQIIAGSGLNKVYMAAINGEGHMPPRGTCLTCSDHDIKAAVDYMISASLHPEKQAGKALSMTRETGEQIYQTNCSSCHSVPYKNAPQINNPEVWAPIEAAGFLKAYQNVIANHPDHGGCPKCTDQDLMDAIKYMMQQNAKNKNYILW